MVQLEVERKFVPTIDFESRMSGFHNPCRVPFPLVGYSDDPSKWLIYSRLPDKLVRDTYFDLDNQLAKNGVWIRRRQELVVSSLGYTSAFSYQECESWQTKVRLGGDFVDSQVEEIEGEREAEVTLSEHIPGARLAGLATIADLRTHRRTWEVCDAESSQYVQAIRVMLDTVSEAAVEGTHIGVFRHDVGEVEVTTEVEEGTDKTSKQITVDSLRCVLHEFMGRHGRLFPEEPKPVGKLSAYFQWVESTRASSKNSSRKS
ncbi:hypothetical protein LTR36_006044 [Oleoguttula mirabilis]|uniref:CYTH domain-containing protein n=1 Tax=Oleoguttula mirabilis TaxID=1507867 RepID=A0AAV9JD55_9PEZI|nr:hypothetical protein LTR36_006044 [Oleoguttula mirabilis]